MVDRAQRRAVVAAAALSVAALAAAEPTPGLPAKMRVLVAADEMPEMFSFAPSGTPGLERELVEGLLDYALASKRDAQLEAGAFLGPSFSAAWAVRPGDGPRLAALDGYLRGMGRAGHALMFRYLSEEALSLIALARRE